MGDHPKSLSNVAWASFWVLVACSLLLLGWQYLPPAFGLQTFLFPRFTDVIGAFRDNQSELLSALWTTLTEGVLGVAIGGAIGFLIAAVAYYLRPLRRGLLGVLVILNCTPQVGLAPVAVLFLGSGINSKVALIGLVSAFTMVLYTLQGLDRVPKEDERLLQSFGVSEFTIFRRLRVIHALPSIMTGLRFAAGQAIILAIVGEAFSSSGGIGHLILAEVSLAGYVVMWAAAIEGALASLVLFGAVSLLERRVTWWAG
jgi:NitT/TauT family transport system permease protein